MGIPSNYQNLSGFRTAYTETELRLAIAISEAFIENSLGGGGSGGTVRITDGTNNLAVNPDGSINTSFTGTGALVTGVASSTSNIDLLTNTVNGWYDAGEYQSVSFQIIGSAGISGASVIFEQTNDNSATSGTALAAQYLSSSIQSINPLTGTTFNASSGSQFFIAPRQCRYIRARLLNPGSGGTVRCIAYLNKHPYSSPITAVMQASAANLRVDPSGVTSPVSIASAALTPNIYNVTLTNANTEYSQSITSAKKLAFKVLSGGDIRYAYATGRVSTPTAPYYTLSSLTEESEDFGFRDTFTGTLYLASATAGTIVAVKVWS